MWTKDFFVFSRPIDRRTLTRQRRNNQQFVYLHWNHQQHKNSQGLLVKPIGHTLIIRGSPHPPRISSPLGPNQQQRVL
jgi:hypothetical protein